jgi:hypothetical protein
MADNRKMLNFRCPVEVLEAVDVIGRERYPANNDNGCDRSKTLLDIIQAGIAALTNGEVEIEVRQPSKTSNTATSTGDIEELVKKLVAENLPVIQPSNTDGKTDYELEQLIDKRIKESIADDGYVGGKIADIYTQGVVNLNEAVSQISGQLEVLEKKLIA